LWGVLFDSLYLDVGRGWFVELRGEYSKDDPLIHLYIEGLTPSLDTPSKGKSTSLE
jgi:hypothetical protein